MLFVPINPRQNTNDCLKGELAHRLVKQLYGMTNKRDATKQIGRRVRRLEKAQLAVEQCELRGHSREQEDFPEQEDFLDQDLDIRYQVSHSRNDPVDLYSYVKANRDDPAFIVRHGCLTCLVKYSEPVIFS